MLAEAQRPSGRPKWEKGGLVVAPRSQDQGAHHSRLPLKPSRNPEVTASPEVTPALLHVPYVQGVLRTPGMSSFAPFGFLKSSPSCKNDQAPSLISQLNALSALVPNSCF